VPSLLTTKDRVKRRASILTQEYDILINEVVAEVSDDCERYMGRYVERTARTETFEIRAHQQVFRVRGYPITDVSEVKVANNTNDWANVSALDASLYNYTSTNGVFRLRSLTEYDPGFVRVTYTGGMVSGGDAEAVTEAFVTAYPAVAGAVDQMIVEILRRAKSPTGAVMFKGSMVQQFKELGLLNDVRRRLNQLRMVKV
jgi:hypothetical protein